MDILFLLLLTIPIFYIYGIICFIRNFGSKNNPQTITQAVIKELSKKAAESPTKTIKELLEEYKNDPAALSVEDADSQPTAIRLHEHVKTYAAPKEAQPSFLNTWYSNNSINLLLYIGAFFIVSAAAIFVGFQWETISGVTKALLLTLVLVGFFGFGFWFYSLPKIKNAGETFTAIGAILIPVVGAAWYNFVLRDADVPVGIAWLVTSAVALVAYIGLALYRKTSLYSYASTIGTFSLMLSLVKTFGLAQDFYILASILACFILFVFSQRIKQASAEVSKTLSLPAELSSQIAMPITLIYGFLMAVSEEKLFTLEGVLSALIATLFYYIAYKFSKDAWKFALTEILFLASVSLLCKWQHFPDSALYFALAFTAICYALHAYTKKNDKNHEERDISLIIATFSAIICFIVAWFSELPPVHLALLTIAPILIAIITVLVKKTHYPLLIASSFLAILLYITYTDILGYKAYPEYLGLLYLVFGVGKYYISASYHKSKDIRQVAYLATTLYCSLSLLFSYEHHWILLICTGTIAALFFATSLLYKTPSVSYGGVFFLWISLLVFLSQTNTPYEYYPLIMFLFAALLYGASRIAPKYLMQELRASALLASFLSSLYFFINAQGAYSDYSDAYSSALNRNALIGAYGTSMLFGLDYALCKIRSFGYITSIIILSTLLWQISYLGYTDMLLYTTPTGLYFMGIAYTRRLLRDTENERYFQGLGLFLLLIPPLLLSFGDNAMKYSLILGLEGILLVLGGINFSNTMFRFAGVSAIVLAILPQTYAYILSLPRWVVVGIAGIIFLGVAIFLLLKRKEE